MWRLRENLKLGGVERTDWPGGALPSGAVIMWSGSLALIPSGWRLCDGGSGTPDLRNKFVYGTSPGENPGGTGGSATHYLKNLELRNAVINPLSF